MCANVSALSNVTRQMLDCHSPNYPLSRRASNAPFVERMDRIASIDIIAAEIVKVIAAKTNGNISLFVRIARKH